MQCIFFFCVSMIVIACVLLNLSVCVACCCSACVSVFMIFYGNECVNFTFFSSSFALASLVSTLVWSTMLSVDKQRRQKKGKEKEGKKKVVDKIRVSDNTPAHVWPRIHRILQSGACCVHTYIHKQTHTHRASVLCVSLFFPYQTSQSRDP